MAPPGARGRGGPVKRRVGAGLSVERLAASRKSTYDPRIARQKRDALAAGRVNKYRKLRARVLGDSGKHRGREQEDQEESEGASSGDEDRQSGSGEESAEGAGRSESRGAGRGAGRGGRGAGRGGRGAGRGAGRGGGRESDAPPSRRPLTSLERVALKAKAEREAKARERQAQREEWEAREAVRKEAHGARQKRRHEMLRKTRGGQPRMDVRVLGALEKLQREEQSKA